MNRFRYCTQIYIQNKEQKSQIEADMYSVVEKFLFFGLQKSKDYNTNSGSKAKGIEIM